MNLNAKDVVFSILIFSHSEKTNEKFLKILADKFNSHIIKDNNERSIKIKGILKNTIKIFISTNIENISSLNGSIFIYDPLVDLEINKKAFSNIMEELKQIKKLPCHIGIDLIGVDSIKAHKDEEAKVEKLYNIYGMKPNIFIESELTNGESIKKAIKTIKKDLENYLFKELDKIKPYKPPQSSEETELIIFLLDASSLMNEPFKLGNEESSEIIKKLDYQTFLVNEMLKSLKGTPLYSLYHCALVYFSKDNIILNKNNYVPIKDIEVKNASKMLGGNKVDIIKAFDLILELLNKFKNDEDLPENKYVTIYIFTDGSHQEYIYNSKKIKEKAKKILDHNLIPSLVTILLGSENKSIKLFEEISSNLKDIQKMKLQYEGLLDCLAIKNKLLLCSDKNQLDAQEIITFLSKLVFIVSSIRS